MVFLEELNCLLADFVELGLHVSSLDLRIDAECLADLHLLVDHLEIADAKPLVVGRVTL